MKLLPGEEAKMVIHHHYTPFVYTMFKAVLGAVPFFVILYFFKGILSLGWFVLANIILFIIFVLLVIYLALIYWLDKMIITNKRVIYEDWKYLTVRDDAAAFLNDISDIQTEEKGFLSNFKIFDYGMVRIDTPSSYITIEFADAPNPEFIRMEVNRIKNETDD